MRIPVLLVVLLLTGVSALATEEDDPLAGVDWNARDLRNAEDINAVCASCHGPFGQGGGGGVYPRLAGMPPAYLARQIHLFKSRKRENIPMAPYANDRELPEEDVLDISAYLSRIKLKTRPPREDVEMDALERLRRAKQVLNVPRAEGDVEAGRAVFAKNCAKCHGEQAEGKRRGPMLAGQHTPYLAASIEFFRKGDRENEDMKDLFQNLDKATIQNILAFLSILDDDLPE